MKNRILYPFLTLLLFSNVSGMAQVREKESVRDAGFLVMLTPQYLTIKQLRIEFDQKITGQHWLTLAPHYVQNHQRYQTHSGFGLVATYKFFLGDSPSYLGGGGQFTYHTFENYAKDAVSQLDMWLYQTKTTQYGINAVAGYYARILPHILADFYAGVGYRFASTKSTDGIKHSFGNSFFDYDKTGLLIVFGVRVGVML
jgi:hypothetical protein